MAEPFSVALGALQIAGTGLQLAQTLYNYINTVRSAEKQLRPIADHVKLNASVLENVGELLRTEEIRNLCSTRLLQNTQDALDGCHRAFGELKKFVADMTTTNETGKMVVTAMGRMKFVLHEKQLNVLQKSLERFRSSLDLVCVATFPAY